MRVPPLPEVAQDLHGAVAVLIELLYSGQEADAARVLAPFRDLGAVILDTVAAKPYPDVYPPGGTDPWGMVSEALFIDGLDNEIADIVLRRIDEASAAEALAQLRVLGGAFGRSAEDSTALGHRSQPALLWLVTPYEDLKNGADYHAWTRSSGTSSPRSRAARM